MSNQSNIPPFEQLGISNELMMEQLEAMTDAELEEMFNNIDAQNAINGLDILDNNAPDIFDFNPVVPNPDNKQTKHDVLDLGTYYKQCAENSVKQHKIKTPVPVLPKEIRSKDEFKFTETQIHDQCIKLINAIYIKSKNIPAFYQVNVANKAMDYIMRAAEHMLHAYMKTKIKEKVHHASLAYKCMAEANMVLTIMYKSCLNNNGRAFIMFPYAKLMIGLERFILSNKRKLSQGITEYTPPKNKNTEKPFKYAS